MGVAASFEGDGVARVTHGTLATVPPLSYEEGPICAFPGKSLGKQCITPEDWGSVSSP